MFKNRHALSQNLSLMLLSLLIAFFFWAVATEKENPTVKQPVNFTVSLDIENIPEGLMLYNDERIRLDMVLRAPQTVWNALQPDDVHAFVDLAEAQPGEITLPVQVEVRRTPSQVVEVNPKEVTLNLEYIEEKDIPVEVKLQGSPMLGYTADEPDIAPRVVKVRGPASSITQVAHVQVNIEIDNRRLNLQDDFEPVPLDEEGNPVPNVDLNPELVTVNVPIRALSGFRDLAVKAKVVGQPAPGHRITSITVKPTMVMVVGRSSAVQSAPGYLETVPINLEGATESMTITAFLQTLEGLTVLTPPTPKVTVTVGIEVIESGLTVEQEPQLQGLKPGLTVTLQPTSAVAILSGPIAVMEQLTTTDARIVLDLTGLEVGEYTLTPRVLAPEGIRAQSILPESITVIIQEIEKPEAEAVPDNEL